MAGPLGKLRDGVAHRLVMGAVTKAFASRFNELRTAYGLPEVATYDEFILGAPLFLVTTAEPFDYPKPDWPAKVHRVGALAWEPPGEVPDWIAGLPDPLVLVNTSSEYQADEVLAAPRSTGSPRTSHRSSSPCRPASPTTSARCRRTCASSGSSPTSRSWTGRRSP